MAYTVQKTDEQWREELTPEEYAVLRQAGTERAFTGEYTDTETEGTYSCKACGSELTSTCVMEKLAEITSWTGGGLHAETNPASNKPPDCGLVLKLTGTTYERFYPEGDGYDCDPSYVVEVSGPVVDQANLDANRVSQPG